MSSSTFAASVPDFNVGALATAEEFVEAIRSLLAHGQAGVARRAAAEGAARTVVAEEGETLTVDTTFFLARDWPGGNIVGCQGFLERFRFGVDPALNRFFFSSL